MTRESERKRLVELMYAANERFCEDDMSEEKAVEVLADYLLDNGVIVPPVKIGENIYSITAGEILEYEVLEIRLDGNTIWFWSYNEKYKKDHYKKFIFTKNDIGKTVFPTREQAEQALKGGAE